MSEEKEYQIIDTHAHLDLEDFDADRDELFVRSRDGIFPKIKGTPIEPGPVKLKVAAMVLPGITADSSQKAANLAQKYPFLFPGAGVHPNHLLEMKEGDWERTVTLAEDDRTAAIGETGLDLYWHDSPIELQYEYLLRHSLLAKRLGKPIIIHCRDAEKELMHYVTVFRRWEAGETAAEEPGFRPLTEPGAEKLLDLPSMKGVIHSYSNGPETASELLALGFYLGFTGSVTFTGRKFARIWESAKIVPNDRILLETDSPFLTPHPFRGKLERNEPLMSAWTARRLAELRGSDVGEIITQTAANARRLFSIP